MTTPLIETFIRNYEIAMNDGWNFVETNGMMYFLPPESHPARTWGGRWQRYVDPNGNIALIPEYFAQFYK